PRTVACTQLLASDHDPRGRTPAPSLGQITVWLVTSGFSVITAQKVFTEWANAAFRAGVGVAPGAAATRRRGGVSRGRPSRRAVPRPAPPSRRADPCIPAGCPP